MVFSTGCGVIRAARALLEISPAELVDSLQRRGRAGSQH
jgi:hypothetical protein